MRERRIRRWVWIVGSVVLGLVALEAWWYGGKVRPPSNYLVPRGYVGWVRIDFLVPGAAIVPKVHGAREFRFPASGRLATSSKEDFGFASDAYFSYGPDGSLQPLGADPVGTGAVWGHVYASGEDGRGRHQYEQFFVGSAAQFQQSNARHNGMGEAPE